MTRQVWLIWDNRLAEWQQTQFPQGYFSAVISWGVFPWKRPPSIHT